MLAVIKTGGKQYLVTPGQKIKIEKIEKKEGSEIVFPEVLLLEKAKKVIIFKYKPKTRYKVKKGFRQPFTEVEITEIRK